MTRTAATRVVGLVALGGMVALGLSTIAAGMAGGSISDTAAVATSVSFSVDLEAEPPAQTTVHLRAVGVMNFALRRVSMTCCVGCPESSSSQCRRGHA